MSVWASTIIILLVLTLEARVTKTIENRLVCYYTNWSNYRDGIAKFGPENIDPYLCTHLIYAFGQLTDNNTLIPIDKNQDIDNRGYIKFNDLKNDNKNLKTLLGIGGWNEESIRFSPMVASPQRRKEFIKNAIKFLRENKFDGLDINWQHPTFRTGGKPEDRENYVVFIQQLREEFDREGEITGKPRLLLTMVVPGTSTYLNGYNIVKLHKYLDWIVPIAYNYHNSYESSVNHHSSLYSLEENEDNDSYSNINATINYYINAGVDRNKIILSIPTFGRAFTLLNPDVHDIGAAAESPGEKGEFTGENGFLAYYEICNNTVNNDWQVVQPNSSVMGPYAHKGNQWVAYDDIMIIERKAVYVVQMGLGGIMFWTLDYDDFNGICDKKKYPLITAGKEALLTISTNNSFATTESTTSMSLNVSSFRKDIQPIIKDTSSERGNIKKQKSIMLNTSMNEEKYVEDETYKFITNRIAASTEKPQIDFTKEISASSGRQIQKESISSNTGDTKLEIVIKNPGPKYSLMITLNNFN